MKNIDYKDPNLQFPINIPIKYYYVYRPLPLHRRERRPLHDFIDFKNMSGNEILINLENPQNLRKNEICGALIELSKRDAPEGYDWNAHPWIQNLVNYLIKDIYNYKITEISFLTVGVFKLRLNNEELWKKLEF